MWPAGRVVHPARSLLGLRRLARAAPGRKEAKDAAGQVVVSEGHRAVVYSGEDSDDVEDEPQKVDALDKAVRRRTRLFDRTRKFADEALVEASGGAGGNGTCTVLRSFLLCFSPPSLQVAWPFFAKSIDQTAVHPVATAAAAVTSLFALLLR